MVESQRAALDVPSIAYAVVVDGETVIASARGVRDLKTNAPADADTIYRIGSITKSFTGLLVLSLRDDGKLTLADPLAKWIPEATKLVYPTHDSAPLTLAQMLAHRSGLPRGLGQNSITRRPRRPDERRHREIARGLRARERAGHAVLVFEPRLRAARHHRVARRRRSVRRAPQGARLRSARHEARRPWTTRRSTRRASRRLMGARSRRASCRSPRGRWATPRAPAASTRPRRTWRATSRSSSTRTRRGAAGAVPGRASRSSRREAHAAALPTGLSVTRRTAKPGEFEVDAVANAYAYGWEVAETCEIDRILATAQRPAVDGFGSEPRLLARLRRRLRRRSATCSRRTSIP